MLQKKAAGTVVFYVGPGNKIEYLLLKHSEKYWNFPKGGVERGESEIKAAVRETIEETGLRGFKVIPGFRMAERYFFKPGKTFHKPEERGKVFFKTVAFYLAKAKDKNVKISDEHKGFEWLSLENALQRFKRKNYAGSQKILKSADEFIRRNRQKIFTWK